MVVIQANKNNFCRTCFDDLAITYIYTKKNWHFHDGRPITKCPANSKLNKGFLASGKRKTKFQIKVLTTLTFLGKASAVTGPQK